ncbi:AAA family ATPase [Streptosporangium sp. NPDC050280]|uniref:HelD family protein n=1 Tax=unclassified Streptosporangium TaxID=2632669 RepID=UPI00341509EA
MSIEALREEQEYVSMLYGRLDELREHVTERLTRVLATTGGNAQARVEREAAHAAHAERLAQLNAAEHGLCFGRLDMLDGERRYIGRMGLLADDVTTASVAKGTEDAEDAEDADDTAPLLIDWRAPAARPFYLATAVTSEGVRRRRHIKDRDRTVVEVHDEVLDLESAAEAGHEGLAGEATLLAALNAGRTGRMTDIVQTIQAEQDRVIRSEHTGVLVVQGGPGTGKTAVALHRAAYLLYTRRRQLARRVVLVIGPNATFLRYVGNVLPALGETSVLLSTIGELYPGVTAEREERPETVEVKGRSAMAEVVAAAVRDREWVPEDHLEVEYEGQTLRLDRRTCERVRDLARSSLLQHNPARPIVVREISEALAEQYAERVGTDPFDGELLLDDDQVEGIRREMLTDGAVLAALDELWPDLTPQRLLTDLFGSPERIASATPGFTPEDRAVLLREPGGGWSPADVPLLDEAAELLGEDTRAERIRQERERRERVRYAQGVLDVAMGSRATDLEDDQEAEILTVNDLIDADTLAGRHEEEDHRTSAERAAADRTWTFGHVIVDEAQELSEMAWRLLMRRCPARSMTVVGDTAQSGDPGGTLSWGRVLDPYVKGRWRLANLTRNYRVPAEIMAVAAEVLTEIDADLEAPVSVRESGVEPWALRVSPEEFTDRLVEAVAAEAAGLVDRRLAVITPDSLLEPLGLAIAASVPEASVGENPDAPRPVVVLNVRQAKGLEFDEVLVVEPGLIVAESPRGLNNLYVALTRATQRLGVLHTPSGPVPRALRAWLFASDLRAGFVGEHPAVARQGVVRFG